MKQTGSNLVTGAGIVLLTAALFAAAYFRADSLVILLALILLISVISYLWTYFSLSMLETDSTQPAAEGFPGDELIIHASLMNRKLLPVIWLKISLPQTEALSGPRTQSAETAGPLSRTVLHAASADGTLQTFLWLMPFQTIEWELKMHAQRRGVYTSKTLRAAAGDGFGLAQQERDLILNKPFELVVFPELTDVNTAPLRRCVQENETVMQGIYEDPTLLRSVRAYQFADPAGKINWKQSARSGQLMVNVYEKQQMRHIALAPDTESFVRTVSVETDGEVHRIRQTDEEAFESMVSVLASAAVSLLEQGLYVTLYLPRGHVCASNESQARELLYALSFLDPESVRWDLPGDDLFAGRHRDGPLFLFTKRRDDRIGEWLDTYRGMRPHVICSERPQSADPSVWPLDLLLERRNRRG